MLSWTTHSRQEMLGAESRKRFEAARRKPELFDDPAELREALLDFIADFSNWDNSSVREYLETSRALTQSAHEALGGSPGTKPLVVDPFAGGGSIPLEALRVGADAFASDLNPVPVLLNKIALEYIPKYGERLTEGVRKWGKWIKQEAEKQLAPFYPKDPGGATPIAYLWARTIQCEGPGCGAEVPLIRSLWLAKRSNRSVGLQLIPRPRAKRVDFQIITKAKKGWVDQSDPNTEVPEPNFDGTIKRGSVTCPCCGFTTPIARVRSQLKKRRGGANDARLMCVVTTKQEEQGRFYRLPTERDTTAVQRAANELDQRRGAHKGDLPLVPEVPTPQGGGSGAVVHSTNAPTGWTHLQTSSRHGSS
jgi:adenine-specific DNA methylase